ncbi:hypothetical protein PQR39_35560 [Paraburkholderia sediminicola]|uniref:hypothetical protein n=1 Tax=Paraburkholderia sediminicola TaxID=458836 RepID=UPI0038B9D6E6
MNDTRAPRPVLLFMKAVTKKQVWIPGFTKRNGQVVQGHYAMVNVSTDHDEHKAVAGQGNYTEQQAHKKLSKKDWFNAMPHDHKVAHVLKEATAIQHKASMLSRANSLKKKILAGEKPINAEWKAFHSLPQAKQQEWVQEFHQAGKAGHFSEGYGKYLASAPKEAPESAQEAPKEPPKVVAAKEEAEPAAPAPEPKKEEPKVEPETVDWFEALYGKEAAASMHTAADLAQPSAPAPKVTKEALGDALDGAKAKAQATLEKWQAKQYKPNKTQVELPGDGPKGDPFMSIGAINAGKKRKAIAAAQDEVNGIAKLQSMLSSEDGAKKLTGIVNSTMTEAKSAFEKDTLSIPVKSADAAFEFLILDKLGIKPPKGSYTSHPISQALLAAVKGEKASQPEKKPEPPKEEPKPEPKPEPYTGTNLAAENDAKAAVLDKIEAAKAKLPADHHITPGQKKKLDAIAHALITGDEKSILNHGYPTHTYGAQAAKLANDALEAMGSKHKVEKGQKMGAHAALNDEPAAEHKPEPAAEPAKVVAAQEGPKEGDTKEGADGTLVLKDGHWVKQGGDQAAAEPAGSLAMPEFAEGKEKTGVKAYYEKVAKKIMDHAAAGNLSVLEGMPTDKGNTWKGKTANSKKLMALHAAAIESLKADAPAMESAPADIPDDAPTAATKPDMSDMGGLQQDAMTAIHSLLTTGSAVGHVGGQVGNLQDYYAAFDYPNNTLDDKKVAQYAKDALASLGVEAKHSGSAPASKYPKGVNTSLADDAHAAAEKGDYQTIADIHAYASQQGMGATAEYVAKLAAEQPKEAPAAAPTATPAQSVAELMTNHPEGIHPQTYMQIKGLVDAGNKGAMSQYADGLAIMGDPNAEWAKQVADAMTAKAAVPVKPSVPNYTTATNDVEAAYKKGDTSLLQAWANEKPLNPDLGEVISYAQACLDALNGGPKEGDTKQGADGMLVLRGGHWVKVGGDEPNPIAPAVGPITSPEKLKKLVASVAKPKFEGKNALKMSKTVKELQAIAEAHGADGLKKVVSTGANGGLIIKSGGAVSVTHGWKNLGLASENGKALANYANALLAAMDGTSGAPSATPAVAAASPKPQKVVGAAAPTATESIDDWKQVGPQGGYNPGGTYEDKDGQKWYVKFPAGGEKVAKNELVATKLYALAGVEVPEVKLINQGGKIGLASKIIDGAVANKSALLEGKAKGLLSGFGADAWLANWDTVGNNPAAGKGFDNILFKPDGSAIRIDAGGALLYGGAGGKKQVFENEVHDLKTMLDPSKNANTAAVFGKMSAADITAAVAKIANIPDHEIEGVVMEFGPGTASEKTRLAEKLIARKHNMSEQFPTAKAKKAAGEKNEKKKLDPTALPVDASLLPTPHDFMNWQGAGKPISEKAYVKGNIADEQEILNIALQGNLTALKEFKFQPVDKMTGLPVGEKQSIENHPSKYVQDFHTNVVSYLDMLANPPEALRPMTAKAASTLSSLSAAFKPADFGMTTAKAPKNQQIGFWIALGVAEDPSKFAPPEKVLSASAISNAKAKHPTLPTSVRQFISGVQGSGSYNNPYRDGLEKDHGGNKTREVLTDLYSNATAHEAGTTISKWISFAPEMVKQFMDAPDGLVFQNPGSMCTSYDPTATKHFGKDRITIRYADGAKALDSFASGSFKSEMEVTTLPGARFMVLSRKMVADTEHGKSADKRFELELLMLPPDPTYVDNLLKKA